MYDVEDEYLYMHPLPIQLSSRLRHCICNVDLRKTFQPAVVK